jgi:hypothetical protein
VAATSCGTPGQWADTRLQSVPGGTGTITGVSCASDTFCLAVGRRGLGPSDTAFAAAFNGVSWRSFTAPALSKVSCGSTASTCAGITPDGFAAWDGTRWHEVSSETLFGPDPSGTRSGSAVSCFGRECTVLDSGHMGRWDGQRWAAVAGGDIAASLISCLSVCVAAGNAGTVSRGDGTAWTPVAQISRPGGGASVNAISCEDRDRCLIAGTWPHLPTSGYPAPGGVEAFLYLWDGTTMTPGTGVSGLRDLSCEPGPRCAVARGTAAVLLGNGRTWTEQVMASIPGLPAPVLDAASCADSTCIVAGHATDADGRPHPVAFRMRAPIR